MAKNGASRTSWPEDDGSIEAATNHTAATDIISALDISVKAVATIAFKLSLDLLAAADALAKNSEGERLALLAGVKAVDAAWLALDVAEALGSGVAVW